MLTKITNLTLHLIDLDLLSHQRKLLTRAVMGDKLDGEDLDNAWAFLDVLSNEIFEKRGLQSADE